MLKEYLEPVVEVTLFTEDVVTASDPNPKDAGGDNVTDQWTPLG